MACSQSLELCLYFASFVFLAAVKKLHFILPLAELLLHVPARDTEAFCWVMQIQKEKSSHCSTNFLCQLRKVLSALGSEAGSSGTGLY